MEKIQLFAAVSGNQIFDAARIAAKRLGWSRFQGDLENDGYKMEKHGKILSLASVVRYAECVRIDHVSIHVWVLISAKAAQKYSELTAAFVSEFEPSVEISPFADAQLTDGSIVPVTCGTRLEIASLPIPIGPEVAEFLVEITRILNPPEGCG